MKKSVGILLFAILLIGFASADFELESPEEDIQTRYGPQSFVQGWINIKFQSEPSNSMLKTNFGGFIEILELLKNNNADFTCEPKNCNSNYAKIGQGESSKTFQLNNKTKIIGLRLTGDISSIDFLGFSTQSNAPASCDNQLKIDILNDGIIEKGNNKSSSSSCSSKDYSCFEFGKETKEYELSLTPYCQRIELPNSAGFKVGAWIKKTENSGTITINLHNNDMDKLGKCEINSNIPETGEEVFCEIEHLVLEPNNYSICIESETSGHRIRGNSNPSTKCGFQGNYNQESTAAYQIFAQKKKFDTFGSLIIKDSEDIIYLAEDYLNKIYSKNCAEDCIIPIKFISQINQEITLSNLELKYREKSGDVVETKFYDLIETPAKITSDFEKLELEEAKFVVPDEYGNQTLNLTLGNEKIFSKTIFIERVANVLSLNLKNTFAGYPTKITAKIDAQNSNINRYEWSFGDENEITTTTNSTTHTYEEIKDYEIKIRIIDESGLSSSKKFNISVKSPEPIIADEISYKKNKIESAKSYISKSSNFGAELLESKLDLNSSEHKIKNIETEYEKAISDADYIKLMKELSNLQIPETIFINEEIEKTPLYLNKQNIKPNILEKINGGNYKSSQEEKYTEAINLWFYENIKASIEYNSFFLNYGSNNENIRIFELNIETNNNEDYYIILKDLQDIKFNEDYSTKTKEGYIYIKTSGENKIIFSTTDNIDSTNLPIFISPSLSNLEIKEEQGVCNNNNVCEKEQGESWSNCGDCGSIIMIVLGIFLVVILGIAGYLIFKIKNKKNKKNPFQGEKELQGIINYIGEAKKKRFEKSRVENNLKKVGWSKEQIDYAFKKYKESKKKKKDPTKKHTSSKENKLQKYRKV